MTEMDYAKAHLRDTAIIAALTAALQKYAASYNWYVSDVEEVYDKFFLFNSHDPVDGSTIAVAALAEVAVMKDKA